MIRLTYVENGKPIIGIGMEYSDWAALKDQKKTFAFEIGGQLVHFGYIESKEKLVEKIRKNGLEVKIKGDIDGTQSGEKEGSSQII